MAPARSRRQQPAAGLVGPGYGSPLFSEPRTRDGAPDHRPLAQRAAGSRSRWIWHRAGIIRHLSCRPAGRDRPGFCRLEPAMRVTIGIKIFGIAVGLLILMAVVALLST